MHEERVRQDVLKGLNPQTQFSDSPTRMGAAPIEDSSHLVAVLEPEGLWEKMEKRAVGIHECSGARPLAWANFTSSVRRLASARATALPRLVMR